MTRTKPKSDKVLTIRLPETELEHLEAYCLSKGKTKTEVLRTLIQRLKLQGPKKELFSLQMGGLKNLNQL